jgi:hypothetical protein
MPVRLLNKFKYWTVSPCSRTDKRMQRLVAEARADGNLVAALGTPAAQHGCTRLGLHAGKKPVGLRAVAAVWLKGTLRHLTSTPCLISLAYSPISWRCHSLQVYLISTPAPRQVQRWLQRNGLLNTTQRVTFKIEKAADETMKFDLHKEWCKQNFVSRWLEKRLENRATIKPAYQGRFQSCSTVFGFTLSFLFARGWSKPTRRPPETNVRLHPPRSAGRDFFLPSPSSLHL